MHEIYTAAQLIELFNKGSGVVDAEIELHADLNFSGININNPLGITNAGETRTFTGVLHGNGHSITDFVLTKMENREYSWAGVFAVVSGATIENLVIDSSCSFSGYYTGGLCVAAKGSLVVRNVINKANVNGTDFAGGFIGNVERMGSISFDGCVNPGNINASKEAGGFIGSVFPGTNAAMTITNSENNGTVSGNESGGFVGYIANNQYLNMMFSNTTNNGVVTGSSSQGGFIGDLFKRINML